MSYNWIDAKLFSLNTIMLMDSWIFRTVARNEDPEFKKKLGISLSGNPEVYWYIVNKCPERKEYYDSLITSTRTGYSPDEIRECEVYVLDCLDWAVVSVRGRSLFMCSSTGLKFTAYYRILQPGCLSNISHHSLVTCFD